MGGCISFAKPKPAPATGEVTHAPLVHVSSEVILEMDSQTAALGAVPAALDPLEAYYENVVFQLDHLNSSRVPRLALSKIHLEVENVGGCITLLSAKRNSISSASLLTECEKIQRHMVELTEEMTKLELNYLEPSSTVSFSASKEPSSSGYATEDDTDSIQSG